ncbi:MAG: hypothetical protein CSA21_01165 [Deltaproteobacteria bacterium]|nr:MAG: hypothetical protein CSA21_01165 [Deltaproteobacteria bacterium]
MTDFKKQWDVKTAMEIVQHPTVDSELWAEAVEWLLIYGPPEVKELLSQASGYATGAAFPELQPVGYDKQGNPCYSLAQLAESLGMSEEEAQAFINEKEQKHGVVHHVEPDDTSSLQ